MYKKIVKKSITISLVLLILLTQLIVIAPSIVLASQENATPEIEYKAHVEYYGWLGYEDAENNTNISCDKNFSGTTGESKRMEALEVNFDAPKGAVLKYRAHVQDIGWMDWVTADSIEGSNYIGTTGQSKRAEAIQIVVEGLEGYKVEYRAHVQDKGWMDWVTANDNMSEAETLKDGTFSGTQGESKRMEALQIVVVPTTTTNTPQVAQPESTIPQNDNSKELEEQKVQEEASRELEEQKKQEEARRELEEQKRRQEEAQKQLEEEARKEEEERQKLEAEAKAKAEESKKQAESVQQENQHIHTYTDWKTITESTCRQKGLQSRECTVCKEVELKETPIELNKHSFERAEWLDVKGTCTRRSQEFIICTICGTENFKLGDRAPGHIWDTEKKVDVNPTCTNYGEESIHCLREGCTERKEITKIEKISHDFEEVEEKGTCITPGRILNKCKNCNYSVVLRTTGYGAHVYETLNDRVNPTCTSSGHTESKQCKVCKRVVNGETIKALGHELVVTTKVVDNVGVTVTTKCNRCNIESIETHSITYFKSGHKWNHDYSKCEGNECDYSSVWWWAWNNKHRENVIWFVGFTCDTSRAEGFDNHQGQKVATVLEGRRGNEDLSKMTITMKAPKAKEGFRFEGWYEVESTVDTKGKKVENTSSDNYQTYVNGDTITVSFKDMDKGYEARYVAK